jgi:hypothetical protein
LSICKNFKQLQQEASVFSVYHHVELFIMLQMFLPVKSQMCPHAFQCLLFTFCDTNAFCSSYTQIVFECHHFVEKKSKLVFEKD